MLTTKEKIQTLKTIQRERSFTQEKLAGAIGISTGGLSEFYNYEKGGKKLHAKVDEYLRTHWTIEQLHARVCKRNVDDKILDLANEIGIASTALETFLKDKEASGFCLASIEKWCICPETAAKPTDQIKPNMEEFSDELAIYEDVDSEDEVDVFFYDPVTIEDVIEELSNVSDSSKGVMFHYDQVQMTDEEYKTAEEGYLYVLTDNDPTRVKTGRTKDINSRMGNLGQGNPDLKLSFLVHTNHHVFAETKLKKLLEHMRYESRSFRNTEARKMFGQSCATEWYSVDDFTMRRFVLDVATFTDRRMQEFASKKQHKSDTSK